MTPPDQTVAPTILVAAPAPQPQSDEFPDLRNFSPELLRRCDEWFANPEITAGWTIKEKAPAGESQSFWADEDGTTWRGIAKPGPPVSKDRTCRAAHEKIAFDLAHVLKLPVPPVALWPLGMPSEYVVGRSISIKAFPQLDNWDGAMRDGLISDELKASARAAVSAMRAFHSWISDTDRKSDHVIVSLQSKTPPLALAFIDHANSMSHVWKSTNHPAGPCPLYVPVPLDDVILRTTVERIATFPDAEITRLVNRVPSGYLPDAERTNIIANLLLRKGALKGILGLP
jgi:hypothetical protein